MQAGKKPQEALASMSGEGIKSPRRVSWQLGKVLGAKQESEGTQESISSH